MKTAFPIKTWLAMIASIAVCGVIHAQTTVTTYESTANGTISSFEPDSFVIRSDTAPEPLTYSYGKTMQYVDEAGNVITRESITPGAPVTVHYVREGNRLLADRIVVHKTITTTTEPGRPLTKKEAKELREAREHPDREARRAAEHGKPYPPADPSEPRTATTTTTTTTTTSDGVVSSLTPDQFVVRSTSSPEAITYQYTKTTQYVDDAGAPVSVEVVKSGVPVTVSYVREGDGFLARRVIVHTRRNP